MKQPESFVEAISPNTVKTTAKEKEKFDVVSLQVFPMLALDKNMKAMRLNTSWNPFTQTRIT